MEVNDMYWIVRKRYPGQSWKNKVDCMSDEQIIAIYYRLEKDAVKPKAQPKKTKLSAPKQMTLEGWDQ